MGNKNNKEKIKTISKKLTNPERLDYNKDGIVTKDELKKWVTEQKKDLQIFQDTVTNMTKIKYQKIIKKNEKDLIEYEKKLKELKNEIKSLKKQTKNKKIINKKEISAKEINNKEISIEEINKEEINIKNISKQKISEFVNNILKDEAINIKYFPDWVERKLYNNIFTILINLLDNLLEGTNINFLGHQLTFDIKPKEHQF